MVRVLVAVVFVVGACAAGYYVFTSKREQAETPSLDVVANMLTDPRREQAVVTGTLDGRAVTYRNYISRQTTYSEVRVAAPGAPRFGDAKEIALDDELKKQVASVNPFRIECDGNELRVQASHIIRNDQEAVALVKLGAALAAKRSPR